MGEREASRRPERELNEARGKREADLSAVAASEASAKRRPM